MIQAEGLKKTFGNVTAVEDVSFEVKKGETFGLLGPNGAGKTTTLHMLNGLLEPDEGQVHINGYGKPGQPSVRKKMGTAPQKVSLYGQLTGEENLRFFGRLMGVTGEELTERVDWALSFSGLSERRGDPVSEYSGGMKRRLNLVTALLHDPPLLFLDEPTVGVDPQSRNHIFESVEELQTGGTTILYTTHYMEEAERLCDRVGIIDRGRIRALDSVEQLIRKHGGNSNVAITFDDPPGVEDLPFEGTMDQNQFVLETDDPGPVLRALSERGIEYRSFSVKPPDLETVFLNLTGRRLRNE